MSQSPADRTAATSSTGPALSAADAVPDLPAGLGSTDADAPVQYTSADVAGAAEVLRSAENGEAELLLALTDEQLAGLEGYERRQFTATPWLDEHAEQRRFAAGVGLRALIAAGRVSSVTDTETETGQQRWRADSEIAGCLVLRRTASGFTTAERTVQTEQGPQVHRLHYYVHDAGVLEEEVTTLGIHRFTPLRSEQVGARLVALMDPAGVAAGDGAPMRVRASALAASDLARQLALTRALTVLTTVRTADGAVQQASVYATPTQVLTMEALDPSAQDPELEFRAVDAKDLHALATVVVAGRGEPG